MQLVLQDPLDWCRLGIGNRVEAWHNINVEFSFYFVVAIFPKKTNSKVKGYLPDILQFAHLSRKLSTLCSFFPRRTFSSTKLSLLQTNVTTVIPRSVGVQPDALLISLSPQPLLKFPPDLTRKTLQIVLAKPTGGPNFKSRGNLIAHGARVNSRWPSFHAKCS